MDTPAPAKIDRRTIIGLGATLAVVLAIVGIILALYFTHNLGNSSSSSSKPKGLPYYAQQLPVPLRPKTGSAAAGSYGSANAGVPGALAAAQDGPTQTPAFKNMQASLAKARAAQDASIAAYRCTDAPTGLSAVHPALRASMDQTGTLPKLIQTVTGDSLGHVMHTSAKPTALDAAFDDGNLHMYDPEAAREIDRAMKASAPASFNFTDEQAQQYKTEQMARALMLEANPDPSVDDVLGSASVMIATRDMIRRAINMESVLAMEAVSCQAPLRFQYLGPLERPPLPLPVVDPFIAEGTITPGLENYLCEVGCGRPLLGGV